MCKQFSIPTSIFTLWDSFLFDIVLPLLVLALASSLLDGVAGFCKVSSLAFLAPNFESAVELLLNPVTGLGTAVV